MATEAQSELKVGLKEGRIVTPAGLVDTSSIDDLLQDLCRPGPDGQRIRRAADTVPRGGDRHGHGQHGRARKRRPRDRDARQHGDSRRVLAGSPERHGPLGRRHGAEHSRRRRARDVRRRRHRRQSRRVSRLSPEKLVQATQLLSRSMAIGIIANEEIQLESLGERDVRIDVPMGDITTSDFERVPETIPLGEAAARAMADRLVGLCVAGRRVRGLAPGSQRRPG